MLEFVISNYIMFIVAGIVLLLGLFGYMMDKKKYKQYRDEIVNEQKAIDSLENAPDIDNIATPVMLDNMNNSNVEETSAPVIQDATPQPETTQN